MHDIGIDDDGRKNLPPHACFGDRSGGHRLPQITPPPPPSPSPLLRYCGLGIVEHGHELLAPNESA